MPTIVRDDLEDQFQWDTITTTTSEEGQVLSKDTIYDNGLVTLEEFSDGVRSSVTQHDTSEDGSAKTWEAIYTSYDEGGDLAQRDTVYDNGLVKLEEFSDGVRSSTTQHDTSEDGSAAKWEQINITYNAEGGLSGRDTVYDDGTVKLEEFSSEIFAEGSKGNSIRSQTVQLDASEDGSAKSWQEITTQYDLEGKLASRSTSYDNGTVKFEEFDEGVRASTTQVDESEDGSGAKWQNIEITYDDNGALASRITTYDNETDKREVFTGGERALTVQNDLSEDGSAQKWQEISSHYDEGGQITSRSTLYDDFIYKAQLFEDGTRSTTIEIDASESGDAASWGGRVTQYDDDGDLASKQYVEDDGDHFIFEYADGDVARSTVVDLDGSEEWYAQITTYDAENNVQDVTHYDSYDDVPVGVTELIDNVYIADVVA
jgi:hypothetical protein